MARTAPRVVLDTNVVLSALLFTNGRLAWLRRAWQQGQLQPLICKQTASELLRVLAYPKFKLTAQDQQDLLADFLPYAHVIELPQRWPELPACRDEKDQVFLVLAHVGQAQALVTGDADLLALRDAFPAGWIVTPEAWAMRR
ncbi:putative toxin-antitoxin system toxin component, PIN family [Allofranklinella schreckenbergeri]|uniref:Putative toxin-antitoxin system toxin component, PIN family n=1 Tax=Allofranklinella schreckenbergeri TaxID=1076744 RepID=A0A3M6R591_9BURK|nr:putative toxin-antitoxin system toxin component, PIN family [Allofranklinella schreckenbergeri]RMX10446.1 putative toxin-antitoxin system toxin component, PIN family [Allofranklinella schreckenbergeri]